MEKTRLTATVSRSIIRVLLRGPKTALQRTGLLESTDNGQVWRVLGGRCYCHRPSQCHHWLSAQCTICLGLQSNARECSKRSPLNVQASWTPYGTLNRLFHVITFGQLTDGFAARAAQRHISKIWEPFLVNIEYHNTKNTKHSALVGTGTQLTPWS